VSQILRGRDHFGHLDMAERTILKRNSEKYGKWGYELDSSRSGLSQMVGSCEYGNEPSSYMKGGKFLACLSDY
jgi:hypothetical protein